MICQCAQGGIVVLERFSKYVEYDRPGERSPE